MGVGVGWVVFHHQGSTFLQWAIWEYSKMPTVRNARSLVTSRELPSGLQI